MKTLNRILITGGAGFVGSNLALLFKEKFPQCQITIFDNLKRRGSELNLVRLKTKGVEFVHGDIRVPQDFEALTGQYDLFIEASAEPSVLAGYRPGESPSYALHTNLTGTIHCLEWAAKHTKQILFLSTSRIYGIEAMKSIPLTETSTRFAVDKNATIKGLTDGAITEEFSTKGARSIYGTTKLASELLVEEYCRSFGINALINRCSVICGPWQMGKVDQGVFTLWMARHHYSAKKAPTLSYTGFGGKGFQVRDLLHPKDLFDLLLTQLEKPNLWDGSSYNAGGGMENSTSLRELTTLCEKITKNELTIGSVQDTAPVDVPYYVTNNTKVAQAFGWKPKRNLETIFSEIHGWIQENHDSLKHLFI